MTKFLDLTPLQKNPPDLVRGKRKHLVRRGRVVERAPKDITTIVVHQTACVFGPLEQPDKRHVRALGVACHALAFNDGVVALPNPLPWYVWHGNEFNPVSLGLEIEGHFPGLPDDPSTPRREDIATVWGGKATPLTATLVEASCAALDYLVAKGRELGMPIEFIAAHRQSSDTRRSDPGWEIWRTVVLEYAVPKLGLKTLPSYAIGNGRPIPKEWDPHGVGRY